MLYAGRQLSDEDSLSDCLDISHSQHHLHTIHLSCSLEPSSTHQNHQEQEKEQEQEKKGEEEESENTDNNQVE